MNGDRVQSNGREFNCFSELIRRMKAESDAASGEQARLLPMSRLCAGHWDDHRTTGARLGSGAIRVYGDRD
jgi:hypothetical protein